MTGPSGRSIRNVRRSGDSRPRTTFSQNRWSRQGPGVLAPGPAPVRQTRKDHQPPAPLGPGRGVGRAARRFNQGDAPRQVQPRTRRGFQRRQLRSTGRRPEKGRTWRRGEFWPASGPPAPGGNDRAAATLPKRSPPGAAVRPVTSLPRQQQAPSFFHVIADRRGEPRPAEASQGKVFQDHDVEGFQLGHQRFRRGKGDQRQIRFGQSHRVFRVPQITKEGPDPPRGPF